MRIRASSLTVHRETKHFLAEAAGKSCVAKKEIRIKPGQHTWLASHANTASGIQVSHTHLDSG